ncbi:MAG TPA: RNA 2',3'-cyclic phosphodiesterase [Sphingomicrobium sp.]|jgi:RNA 2',3'-cyclic 3'-phosphodiesterase|nr:RNA 2',3'-cyclic phosphodiesterase [Sphingomicrobium sp.]
MHRLFVAIVPPQDIRDLLIDAMGESPELRWVGEEQLHLTLRFVGEVERPLANDLASALAQVQVPAFKIAIAGIGRFDRRGGGAIWAGVEPKAPVAALAAKVERTCQAIGLQPERRAFHPHITLARWKGGSSRAADAFVLRARALSSEPFLVDRYILFESHLSRHGPHYEAVEAFPLDSELDHRRSVTLGNRNRPKA